MAIDSLQTQSLRNDQAKIALEHDNEKNLREMKEKNKIELELPKAWMSDHPTVAYWIEKEKDCWSEVGIEFSIKLNS